MARPTEDEVSMEMSRDGFLSPLLDIYKSSIIDAHTEWFDFARRLNQTIVKMWLGHPITAAGQKPNDPEPLAVRLMARSMNGFEAAVIVLERGMTVEGGTLARSVYESGFWLAYIREHPVAARKQFLFEELVSAIGRNVSYEKMFAANPERLAEIKATLVDLRRKRSSASMQKMGIETVATNGKSEAFYTFYEVLCGSSAHASVLSTDHYLQFFDDETAGHTIGPDIDGAARKLAYACHGVLLSALAFAGITEADAAQDLLLHAHEFYLRASNFEFGQLD